MMKKSVLDPMHPERICWGCERYCAADDLVCGNGSVRTQHPRELFGPDWQQWADKRSRSLDQIEDRGDGNPPRNA